MRARGCSETSNGGYILDALKMTTKYTREYQYQFMIEMMKAKGLSPMSLRASMMWRLDPKLLGFTLATSLSQKC